MKDRPFSKKQYTLIKQKLRQELIDTYKLPQISTVEMVMQSHSDDLLNKSDSYQSILSTMNNKIKSYIDKQSNTPLPSAKFYPETIPRNSNYDQDPTIQLNAKRKEAYKKRMQLEYETAIRRKVDSKRINHQINHSSSTFNLEEKWKEERKVKQKSELDCFTFNCSHSKSPVKSRNRIYADEESNHKSCLLFQSVGQEILSDDLHRTEQINQINRLYQSTQNPILEYELSKIEQNRSHFQIS